MKKLSLVALAAVAAASIQAQTFADNFNRADAADLGANYEHFGGAAAPTRTIGNQAGNITLSVNLALITAANYSAAYTNGSISADVFHDGSNSLGYVALAIGHNGLTAAGNGIYMKVQGTGATGFTSIGFYTGINGTSTAPWNGATAFFTATAPFLQARMTVWASDATTINLGLDTNFDQVYDQTYTRTLNLGAITLADRAGIAVYGTSARADNLNVGVIPEPATMTVLGLGVLALARRRRR